MNTTEGTSATAVGGSALSEGLGPDGKLHADGYFTWHRRDGYVLDAKLPAEFVLADKVRAALDQKHAEYEDLKQTMHNMTRNHALQLEAARKHEPESVPELRAQLQTLGLWIAEALPTLDTVEPECSTEAELLTALIRRGEMLVLASLARGGALGPNGHANRAEPGRGNT